MEGRNLFVFAIFGIILLSGLGHSNVIDASSIQDLNGQLVFANISCYTCEGASCAVSDPTTLPIQACNLFGAECVTTFNLNKSVAARGCSNMLSAVANGTCISYPGALCFDCISSLCNTAMSPDDFVECYQCDSYTNSECVWNPNDASVATVECDNRCIVALLPKSSSDNMTYETYRGCESELDALGISTCTANQNCWTCNTGKCNAFNQPSTRLTCNFCANPQCNSTFQQPCLGYRPDDKCAYVLNSDASVSYLSCASNFDPSTLDYMTGLGILVECNSANCNTLANAPQLQTGSNTCMSCSSKDTEWCATDPSKVTTNTTCTDLNQMCVTRITGDGHTIRGCLADQPQADFLECYMNSNETYCNACNSSRCNAQVFPANRLQCYICNSNDDDDCTSNPKNPSICPIFSATESCTQYSMNSTVYRGCSSQFPCSGDNCSTCNTSGCNNKDLSGGSATVQLTGALLFASLLVFLLRL